MSYLADLALTSRLPPGWTVEVYWRSMPDLLVIDSPRGSVTLNTTRRTFGLGVTVHGHRPSSKRYTGRGWLGRLVDDAITALKDVSR